MADWSGIPSDILTQVALDYLVSAEDIISLSAVCHAWSDACTLIKDKWSPVVPWVMLSEPGEEYVNIDRAMKTDRDGTFTMNLITDDYKHPHDGNPKCLRKLFDPFTCKVYELSLPETFGRTCFGSPYGWIFTIGLDLEIHLFNPLTKSRIRLPPQWTIPQSEASYVTRTEKKSRNMSQSDRIWTRTHYVKKGIVLRIPDQEKETFVVMVVHRGMRYLAFARPGDSKWTPVLVDLVEDVIYWKGKFVIFHGGGMLCWFDYAEIGGGDDCSASVVVPRVLQHSPINTIMYIPYRRNHKTYWYLLDEEDDGGFYVILKEMYFFEECLYDEVENSFYDVSNWETISFSCFRPEIVDGSRIRGWKKIEDLGNMAVFVGNCSAMKAHAVTQQRGVNNTKCSPNTISFMDDDMECYSNNSHHRGGHDTGVYEMKEKMCTRRPYYHVKDEMYDEMRTNRLCYDGEDIYSRFCRPLFFKPSLS